MSAPFGSVFAGTIGGMVAAAGAFYFITIRQAFGGANPVDQNDAWQVKTEDLQLDGKWVRVDITRYCVVNERLWSPPRNAAH
jgi:hypothetical protein